MYNLQGDPHSWQREGSARELPIQILLWLGDPQIWVIVDKENEGNPGSATLCKSSPEPSKEGPPEEGNDDITKGLSNFESPIPVDIGGVEFGP